MQFGSGSFAGKVGSQCVRHLLDELDGLAVLFTWHLHGIVHADCQVLRHEPFLHRLNHTALQTLCEVLKLLVAVKLSTMQQSPRPGEDACYRIS